MRRTTPTRTAARPRYEWLYALPGGRLPRHVSCAGQHFEHLETLKHDFFAATGLYRGPNGLAVLKMGRQNDILTVPAGWIGTLLTRREVRFYKRLQGTPGVPRLIGTVAEHGFLHDFVPGHPLGRHEQVSDTFFNELSAMLAGLHAQHMAYVDLNKRQNILMGADGKPYLIDFQISLWLPPAGWRRLAPVRWLLRRFQLADRYHCLKHKRRLRPDLLTAPEAREVARISIWIHMHRRLTRPLTNLRRRLLKRLNRSETAEVAGSTAK